MRLLIDAALSPLVARKLRDSGYDAVHVRDRGMVSARDSEIVALAELEDRIIISADTDFGTLLTLRRQAKPSFILLRRDIERRPHLQVEVLLRELPEPAGTPRGWRNRRYHCRQDPHPPLVASGLLRCL